VSKDFSWRSFESELGAVLHNALAALATESNGAKFYACALFAVYREEDGVISLPTLAVACESGAALPGDEGFWGERWNPPDWSHPAVGLSREVCERLEKGLCAEACRSTPEHWQKVEQRLFHVLVRLARKLRKDLPSLLPATPDFVCFVHDEELGFQLASQSIPQNLIEKHFAPQLREGAPRNDLGSMAEDERARYLVTRFGCYEGVTTNVAQEELLKLRSAALPALIDTLDDPDHGWTAAMVLGRIGIPDRDAIAALRKGAQGHLWYSTALGMLGDHDWLSVQTSDVAINGLCARLMAISQAEPCLPLDYRPLEQFLDNAEEEARAMVEQQLEPGCSYVDVLASDAEETVRGMRSAHAVVRWHAASVAGERRLGKKAGSLLLPALATLLDDQHPFVRRLAALSIGYWKAEARKLRPLLEKLGDDPDKSVSRAILSALRQIG
jgi:hypothetical protein